MSEELTGREVLRLIADGAELDDFEFRYVRDQSPTFKTCATTEITLIHFLSGSLRLRRKPKTITATITIPEPIREAPPINTKYWTISDSRIWELLWKDGSLDQRALRAGLAFRTKGDAEATLSAYSAAFGGGK